MEFQELHKEAVAAAGRLRSSEAQLVELLLKIEDCRGHQRLGYPSLFVYVTDALKLSEPCAYRLITVARKSREVPELKNAVTAGEISISKAKVIASVINTENSAEWIVKAQANTFRELQRLAVAECPVATLSDKSRPIAEGVARLELSLPETTLELLRRVQDVLAQKRGKHQSLADAIKVMGEDFLQRNDPLKKATRCTSSSLQIPQQIQPTLPARSRHLVNKRDQGRCQYVLPTGKLCPNRRWLHFHHLKPKAEGGSHHPDNLQTLCASHHRIVHSQNTSALSPS